MSRPESNGEFAKRVIDKTEADAPVTPEERELRNIYAGMAITSIMTIPRDANVSYETIADKAFELADAMIIRSRK
jgi:hypothetical protein